MNIKKLTFSSTDYPEALSNIPAQPKQLYIDGNWLPLFMTRPRVAIVGSRQVTVYVEKVTCRS